MCPDHNLDTCASLQNAIGYLWATELQPIDIKKKKKKSCQTKSTQTDQLPQARTSDYNRSNGYTLGAEIFGLSDFWLETSVIIQILTHP